MNEIGELQILGYGPLDDFGIGPIYFHVRKYRVCVYHYRPGEILITHWENNRVHVHEISTRCYSNNPLP
jgi:hypothetical protein